MNAFSLVFLLSFIDNIYSIYIVKSRGVDTKAAVTMDDGDTWSLTDVKVTGSKGGYCVDDNICFLVSSNGKKYTISRTVDGGKTWTRVASSTMPGEQTSIDYEDSPGIYCADVNTCLFGLFDVVIKTDDGFASNKVVLTIPKSGNSLPRVSSIQCIRNNSVCMVSVDASTGQIYRSVDGGSSWNVVFSESYTSLEQLSCRTSSNGHTICIMGTDYDGIYISVDEGESWQKISYEFYMIYMRPHCPPDVYDCRRTPKIDSIACLSLTHCLVAFRGYSDGSGRYVSTMGGALCTVILGDSSQKIVVKCSKMLMPNTRVKFTCSSRTACLGVTTREYVSKYYPYREYSYIMQIVRYQPDTREWSVLSSETNLDVTSMQYIAGKDFVAADQKVNPDSGNNALSFTGSNKYAFITIGAIHLLLFVFKYVLL